MQPTGEPVGCFAIHLAGHPRPVYSGTREHPTPPMEHCHAYMV